MDRRRAKVPVTAMGFSMRDRVELLKLTQTDEATLGAKRITDCLSPRVFRDRVLVDVVNNVRLPTVAQCRGVQAVPAPLPGRVHPH